MRAVRHIAKGGQRGLTIPLVALIIMGLLVVTALAIDMGVLYTARTSAQHAADAAALAGAFTFLNPGAPQPDAAIDAAISVAASNQVLGDTVVIEASNVLVDTAQRRVTVTVPRTGEGGVTTYFARAFGVDRVDVVTIATAEAAQAGTGARCLKPIFVPNTILSGLPPDEACAQGQVIFDSGNLTAFAQASIGAQVNARPTSPSGALEPSQFYSLDFGSGANTYRCALGRCLNYCDVNTDVVRCGQGYPVETGNMVGPTRQGIRELIGDPPDLWVGVGQYQAADGNIYDTSRSLAVAPVWDNCAQVITPGYHGQEVLIVGFIDLFFEGFQGSDVMARFVNATECAASGGGAGGEAVGEGETADTSTGPYGVPVRLVQTPDQ